MPGAILTLAHSVTCGLTAMPTMYVKVHFCIEIHPMAELVSHGMGKRYNTTPITGFLKVINPRNRLVGN